MATVTLSDIHLYFSARINEVIELSKRGDPWVFLCCSSFIDYLVKAINNKETNASDYKDFIKEHLSKVDIRYKDFEYATGTRDLPEQMYHVLRCGVTHSFSLVPDLTAVRKGGRSRSIVLGHNKKGDVHFYAYKKKGFDTVVFTAESFSNDIKKLVDEIFSEVAPKDARISANIIEWWSKHPPIGTMQFTIDVTETHDE